MAFCVVISDNLGRKTIYASTLKEKSSSKVIWLTDTVLAIDSADLIFANGGVD